MGRTTNSVVVTFCLLFDLILAFVSRTRCSNSLVTSSRSRRLTTTTNFRLTSSQLDDFHSCESVVVGDSSSMDAQTRTKLDHLTVAHSMWNSSDSSTSVSTAATSPETTIHTENNPAQPYSFLLLNTVALIWGSQHVIIKSVLEASSFHSPSTLCFWRFFTSSSIFLPALLGVLSTKNEKTIRAGAELGLYTTLGFAFQSIGLATTTASRSAFLLYLNVKIVPFLAFFLLGRRVSISTWFSAFLAFSGTALLSTDGGPLNVGDLWSMLAAAASAMFILTLEAASRENDSAELNAVSFTTTAVLCGLWVGLDYYGPLSHLFDLGSAAASQTAAAVEAAGGGGGGAEQHTSLYEYLIQPFVADPWPILYLGVFSTALCNYLQTIGQKEVPAERAAIIYSMDPVYGAFFSNRFLGESFGLRGVIGAGLILLGVWYSSITVERQTKGGSSVGDVDEG